MSKYEPLRKFLNSVQPTVDIQSLTFGEIEEILGFELPESAFSHRAWWSNPTSPKDHPHAQAWLDAGWMVDSVDQLEKRVHFCRTTSNTLGQRHGETNYSSSSQKMNVEQEFGIPQLTENLDLLQELGFEEVGRWILEGNSLRFQLDKNENARNILYAFVVQGIVMYIGKSTRSLNNRMNGYRNPGPSQITNINNNTRIRAQLQKGVLVQILVLVPTEELFFKGFSVNIAAGLEDNLLTRIRPPWNDRV